MGPQGVNRAQQNGKASAVITSGRTVDRSAVKRAVLVPIIGAPQRCDPEVHMVCPTCHGSLAPPERCSHRRDVLYRSKATT